MQGSFDLEMMDALAKAIKVTKDAMSLLTTQPAIYFVGLALFGAGASVSRRFVPMKRR